MHGNRHQLAIFLALGSTLAFAAPALAAPARVTGLCNAATAARVVTATNDYRSSLGLSRLAVTSKLVVFAALHARDMAKTAVLTHSSSAGLSFAQRAHQSTYRFSTMRENIAV
ncbi:MAG: CAP domain-containing protein [Gaiellales bacterium]